MENINIREQLSPAAFVEKYPNVIPEYERMRSICERLGHKSSDKRYEAFAMWAPL
jgi:hypothetical protein